MSKKLTNQIIDERIKNKNLIRLDNYINSKIKIHWQCIKCSYIWENSPDNILNGNQRCLSCSKRIKLTNEIFDKRLIGKNIKRIENIKNSKVSIKIQCLINTCNYVWTAIPNNILNGRGCPKCSGKLKLTNQIIDERIKNRKIKRLNDYVSSNNKIKWQCLKKDCNYIWSSLPSSICQGHGCPNCVGLAPLNNNIIDLKLAGRKIERLENYIYNNKYKMRWKCITCNNIWKASSNDIIGGRGCPVCKHKNEKIIFLLLKENAIIFTYQKKIKDINNTELKKYIVDFYIPNKNIIIEYNGRQHYCPVQFGNCNEDISKLNFKKQLLRDEYIRKFCIFNNINLITIDGRIYKNKLLKDFIVSIIGSLDEKK